MVRGRKQEGLRWGDLILFNDSLILVHCNMVIYEWMQDIYINEICVSIQYVVIQNIININGSYYIILANRTHSLKPLILLPR